MNEWLNNRMNKYINEWTQLIQKFLQTYRCWQSGWKQFPAIPANFIYPIKNVTFQTLIPLFWKYKLKSYASM